MARQGGVRKGQFVTKKLTSQDKIIKNALGREQRKLTLTRGQEKTLRRASAA